MRWRCPKPSFKLRIISVGVTICFGLIYYLNEEKGFGDIVYDILIYMSVESSKKQLAVYFLHNAPHHGAAVKNEMKISILFCHHNVVIVVRFTDSLPMGLADFFDVMFLPASKFKPVGCNCMR